MFNPVRPGRSMSLVMILATTLIVLFASISNAQTRKLKLYYLHTGEKATITYKKNGKFLRGGLKKINYFLRDWRRNEPTKMDPNLLDLIWEVYKKSGSRAYIHVISAYRSPATNNMLRKRGRGVAKRSQHTLGKAMDFFLPDVKLSKLRRIGLIKQVGGVGYYPRSGSPFVHMDTGSVRHWPRMSRRELVRVFPRGKTLHVPTDGKPLPGYNQAVASYNSRKSSRKKIPIAKGDEKQRRNFFQRLARRNVDDDGDRSENSPPTPRRVKTTKPESAKKPVPTTPLSIKPVTDKNESVIVENTPEPIKPELPKLASIPVPNRAPRNIEVAPNNLDSGTIAVAQLENEPTPELENAIALVPVPSNRPNNLDGNNSSQLAALVRAENLSSDEDAPNVVSDNNPQLARANQSLRDQLIAQAKEQLLVDTAPVRRPDTDVGSSFETALLPKEREINEETNPVLTRSLFPTPRANNEDPAIPSDNSDLNPVSVIPTLRPQIKETDENIEATSSEIVATIPTAAPRKPEAQPIIIAKLESQPVDEPVKTPNPNQPATQETSAAERLATAPKPLDELSLAWYRENRSGQFVLANSIAVETADAMRAPAYGRAAIRQTPKTVLTAGFIPSGRVQNFTTFRASAVQFQTFTKFN